MKSMSTRDLQVPGLGVGADRGDLLLVPVDEEHPLPDPLGVAAVAFVAGGADHVVDGAGDGRRDPLVTRLRARVRLAAGSRGGDVLRDADAGGEAGDRDDLGHPLDARMRGISLALALAVLRAHRDALAAGLEHDHVAGRQREVRAGGPPGVEVTGPGRQFRGDPGQLRRAGLLPGPRLDHVAGLPVAAFSQVIRHQRPHPQRVRVLGEHPPGISRVQVRLPPVPVRHPGRADRPENGHHAPVMAFLHGAVPDPRSTGDLLDPLLAAGIDGERGLQQLPLQFPPRLGDLRLPVPVIQDAGLLRRPRQHLRELLDGASQRRRQLLAHRARAPVPAGHRHRHRNRQLHRRSSIACRGVISLHDPGTGP
jgi:hypothetical protein